MHRIYAFVRHYEIYMDNFCMYVILFPHYMAVYHISTKRSLMRRKVIPSGSRNSIIMAHKLLIFYQDITSQASAKIVCVEDDSSLSGEKSSPISVSVGCNTDEHFP